MKKVVSLLLAAVMCLALCACDGSLGTNSTEAENYVLEGVSSEEGDFVVPLLPGKYTVKRIGDDDNVKWAAVTPDRSTIVYIKNDGSLYTIGTEAPEAEKVAANVGKVTHIDDAGFVYYDADSEEIYDYSSMGMFYRYTFADKETVKLGVLFNNTIFSKNALSMAYIALDGIDDINDLEKLDATGSKDLSIAVRLLNSDSSEPITVSSISLKELYDVSLLAISKTGDKLIWSETHDKYSSARIYTYVDGEKDTLCSIDGSVGNVQHNDDLSLITIEDERNNTLYVSIGGETEKHKLGSQMVSYNDIYTDKEKVSDSTAAINGLYVSCFDNNGNYDLYWLNNDGDRERVAESLRQYIIDNGRILYIDEEGRLYSAKISGAEIADETKIAGDVQSFYIANDKKTICYYKDMGGSNVWALYVYTGSGEAQKISAEAAGMDSPELYISSDARSVFYFTDLEKVQNSEYPYKGTLMKYSVKDKESTKIASEVLTNSLKDGKRHDVYNTIEGSNFIYEKYVADDDSGVIFNWLLFKGNASEIIAKNLTTASGDKVTAAAEEA